ncbi:MAG TPA: FAD-binding oxidoreductase [Gemmatimonadales bacterium]
MLSPPKIRGIYRTDIRARASYSEGAGIYRIVPRAVALPADVEDLRNLVCWAAEHRIGLIPRGAGSAMGGGNVGDGVILDLTSMERAPPIIDPAKRLGLAGAGTTLTELNAEAARHRLRLPPDPSSGRWATLGGMVATNAAGARSVRYGSVRPWIQALTLLTAEGEMVSLRRSEATPDQPSTAAIARFTRVARPAILAAASQVRGRFPRTRKNSSGYALDAYLESGQLIDLVIGAEGTLGIVTQVEWRLSSIPAHQAGLRIALRSLDQLSVMVGALRSLQPSALELLDRSFLDLIEADAPEEVIPSEAEAVLLAEFEQDAPGTLEDILGQATALATPLAHSVAAAGNREESERLWSIRHAASPILARLPEERRSLQVIEDGCVPVDRVSEYIRGVRRAASARNIPVVIFGHAGDGHIHVNLLPDVTGASWQAPIASLLEEVTGMIVQLGGTPSGEHGDGRLRAAALDRVYGPELMHLFRLVKDSFDPLGIFNRGVILPGSELPISRLKVGSEAAPIPMDIERGLREIERNGGYAKSRLELAGELGARSSELGAGS